MMERAKRINILRIQVALIFTLRNFLKEIENMFSVFLSSYSNSSGGLGELEKAAEKTSLSVRVPTAFFVLPNFHSCLCDSIETRYMFSIS